MPKIIVDETLIEHLAREKALFSRTEITVLPCSTKEQALKIHAKEIADLILIDFDMPKMHIDDFCAYAKTNEKLKHASIVIASPNRKENLDRCLMCGVDAIIIKPINYHELIDTTTKLLKIKKRHQVRVLMKIAVTGKAKDTFYATSQNISVSGISIETDKHIAKGDQVSVTFYLRLSKITINGEVVRKKEIAKNFFQYGMRFITIDDSSRALIEESVKIRQTI